MYKVKKKINYIHWSEPELSPMKSSGSKARNKMGSEEKMNLHNTPMKKKSGRENVSSLIVIRNGSSWGSDRDM